MFNDVDGEIYCIIVSSLKHTQLEDDILTYKAISELDAMYLRQAMKESDKMTLLHAMQMKCQTK